MKRLILLVAIVNLTAALLLAQDPGNGKGYAYGYNGGIVVVPGSSVENPADVGHKAHTNHLIFLRAPAKQTYISGLTPADIATAYSLTGALGGARTIAIVDAFDYPNALSDLQTFSAGNETLGFAPLAPANFSKVYADASGNSTSTVPPVNCGWNQEAALDIEWAHAMAPNAKIVLVEAQSNSFADLFGAVTLAAKIVTGDGGGEVSMSWGGSEYAGESGNDSYFSGWTNVVFIASSGDTGGKTIYPSVSPYVIAAGGTTLDMTGTRGTAQFANETGWSGSGGGKSSYELRPSYQDSISSIVGSQRGVPDFSFDADPSTGVLVYGPTCSGNATGWMVFGGTSVSAPSLAGIINSASSFASTTTELSKIYSLQPTQYRDITSGRAAKFSATSGWDFVTGIGTPLTLAGK